MGGTRMLFVFSRGLRHRLHAVPAGAAPAESYGFFSLADEGYDVRAVDETWHHSPVRYAISNLYQRVVVVPRSGLGYRWHQVHGVRRELAADRDTAIVATNDAIGLPLLAANRRHGWPRRIIQLSIGLVDKIERGAMAPRVRERYLGLMRRAAAIAVFTPGEAAYLRDALPGQRIEVVPLGVDVDWWREPPGLSRTPGLVFAAGRDAGRDFRLLERAVRDAGLRAVIVGDLAKSQGVRTSDTVSVWADMPIGQLRERLWSSEVVAIPTHAATYGSGQTTALHAMAAGRAVVMTDSGWASHFGLVHGRDFVHVRPGDARELRNALLGLLGTPGKARDVGRSAQEVVARQFTARRQGEWLYGLAEDAAGA